MGNIHPLFTMSGADIENLGEKGMQEAMDSLSIWERFWLTFWSIPHRIGEDQTISDNGSFRILWTACSHPFFFLKNILFGKTTAFKAMRHYLLAPFVLLAVVAFLVWGVSTGNVVLGFGGL